MTGLIQSEMAQRRQHLRNLLREKKRKRAASSSSSSTPSSSSATSNVLPNSLLASEASSQPLQKRRLNGAETGDNLTPKPQDQVASITQDPAQQEQTSDDSLPADFFDNPQDHAAFLDSLQRTPEAPQTGQSTISGNDEIVLSKAQLAETAARAAAAVGMSVQERQLDHDAVSMHEALAAFNAQLAAKEEAELHEQDKIRAQVEKNIAKADKLEHRDLKARVKALKARAAKLRAKLPAAEEDSASESSDSDAATGSSSSSSAKAKAAKFDMASLLDWRTRRI